MADEISDMQRRLDMNERNMGDFAKSLTAIVKDVHELRTPLEDLKTDKAVRAERDKHMHERLDRMERMISVGLNDLRDDIDKRFDRLTKPFWAAALALITVLVGAVATFIFKGGLNV